MKLKILLIVSAYLLTTASTTQAASMFPMNVDTFNGAGTLISGNASAYTWDNTSSGVSVGIGPFGTFLPVGTTFDFLYQTNLSSFKGSTVIAPFVLNSNFEITAVARLTEVVTAITGTGVYAFVPTSGTFSIYYDNTANSDVMTGTGFDNGTLIAAFAIDPTASSSNFTVAGGTGTGGGTYNFITSSVNPAYLKGVGGSITGMTFTFSLDYPALNAPTHFHVGGDPLYPDYAVTSNDVILTVDPDSQFTTVPEPSSLVLVAAGLFGLASVVMRGRCCRSTRG